ncbi:MAG: prolipoprotein diacylglyceryl transferase [Chloroflexi bacterium]|nr:prolipoprotein diacylglyceryl transferase [Chloroflexota bacterium]
MLPFVQIGPLLLQMPVLALLAGIWIGLYLTEKEADQRQLDGNALSTGVLAGLLAGIAGARLFYAAGYASFYLSDPLGLLALTPQTMSPGAGLLTGLAVAAIYGWRRRRLPLRPTLDALAPGVAVFMVALGANHFLSGDAYGAPAALPWSIYLWDAQRHPSQIYEMVLALGIFLIILRRPLGQPGNGINFWLLVALSAAARIFLEAYRGDSVIWPGGFRAAQVAGTGVLVAVLWLMRTWSASTLPDSSET